MVLSEILSQVLFTPYQCDKSPLYMACQEGHHDVVLTLLGAGADVNRCICEKVSEVFALTHTKHSHNENYHLHDTYVHD